MTTKTTVVHHSADFDGLFCREIARKFLHDAELIGWDFADPPLALPPDGNVVVLDLPVDRPFGFVFAKPETVVAKFPDVHAMKEFNKRLVWIDHHGSSIASHPQEIPGYRIDGVAACRLAWQWFDDKMSCQDPAMLPSKQEFVDRKVREPLAVRLAGEYDIWDRRDPRAEVFQFGLRSRELTPEDWKWLLAPDEKPSVSEIEAMIDAGHAKDLLEPDGTTIPAIVHQLLDAGALLQRYQQRNDASMMHRSFLLDWEGLKFLALTTARCNSLTFASRDKPETGHDALMGFYFHGKTWTVSLYHAAHRTDLDLSKIAVKHGGGGHKGACGFVCAILPFVLGANPVA
jgi:uncharacterized protein